MRKRGRKMRAEPGGGGGGSDEEEAEREEDMQAALLNSFLFSHSIISD